jgi:hypothetical protein
MCAVNTHMAGRVPRWLRETARTGSQNKKATVIQNRGAEGGVVTRGNETAANTDQHGSWTPFRQTWLVHEAEIPMHQRMTVLRRTTR